MAKGSAFEREICRTLSLWWTEGKRDDVFYRTANSGGRATVRKRKGRDTANAHGDVGASDPIGIPFLKAFAVEIKRGYSRHTIADLLDKSPIAAKQVYEEWIEQAVASMNGSGAKSWMIIHRRDRRETIVTMPMWAKAPVVLTRAIIWMDVPHNPTPSIYHLFTVPLDSLLTAMRPKDIKALV